MIDGIYVEEIFKNCLYSKGEDYSNMIQVEGVVMTVGFKPENLEKYREVIESFIPKLDPRFREGLSFLYLGTLSDGTEWTGLQKFFDLLLVLLIAIGRAEIVTPRELWHLEYGGVPKIKII
jgi:hydroxylamine reductase (hybrid-cluster protein)